MTTQAPTKKRRLTERAIQTATKLRVSRGGKEITLTELETSNDWREYPGAVLIEGVRVMNRNSSNGVVYHDKFIRRAAEIHQNHHASWEHEDAHGNSRPPKSRFGMWTHGRVVEDASGVAIGADADLTIYEGDNGEVDRLISKAIRNPKSLMFSIEVAEGQWDGHDDEDGITHATELTEMLDTAAVSFGGTTSSLSEAADKPKENEGSLTMAEEKMTDRLLERAANDLKEECACHANTKTDLAKAQEENKALKAELAKLKDEKGELETVVQENKRRQEVSAMAEKEKVRLSESDLTRYAKWSDTEVGEQLKKDKKLQELSGRSGVDAPATGGDSSDIDSYELPLN